MTTCPDYSFLRMRLPTSVPIYPVPEPPTLMVLFLCLETWSTQSTIPCCVDVATAADAVRCYVPGTVPSTRDTKNRADPLPRKSSSYLGEKSPASSHALHSYSCHIPATEHQSVHAL